MFYTCQTGKIQMFNDTFCGKNMGNKTFPYISDGGLHHTTSMEGNLVVPIKLQ